MKFITNRFFENIESFLITKKVDLIENFTRVLMLKRDLTNFDLNIFAKIIYQDSNMLYYKKNVFEIICFDKRHN